MRRTLSLLLLLLAVGCSSTPAPLTVGAASSLTDLLDAARQQRGLDMRYQFNSSADVRAQIERGLRADVFVSASADDMDRLEKAGRLMAGTRRNLYRNRLVIVVPPDSKLRTMEEAIAVKRFGMGEPDTVPAGRYARDALQKLGWFDRMHPVYGKDVRVVLGWVSRGEVDAAAVYATDTRVAPVNVVATLPADSHRPIVYPGAVVADAPRPDEARAFLEWLASADGLALAKKYGFEAP